MTQKDITALVITGVIGLVIVIISFILMNGKGSFLIAGFNTMPESKKRRYNIKSLSKFIGGILFPIGILTPCIAIGAIYDIIWLSAAYPVIVTSLIVFAAIYANTGNRFKNK